MRTVHVLRALGPIDVHSIRRDPLLKWMVLLPPLIALATRWLLPYVIRQLGVVVGPAADDLMVHYRPLMGYMLLVLTPALTGMVVGFLLLDQRDDQTLTALQVTPLSLSGYLAYRLAVPYLISIALALPVLWLAGLSALSLRDLLLASLCVAPLSPLFALGLSAIAQNKVQGFTLYKGSGVFLIVPIVAYFVQSRWQFLLGLIPTFWPARLYWSLEAGSGGVGLYFVVGLAYQAALLALLVRRFNRAMTSG